MIGEEAERIYRILDDMRAQFIVFEGTTTKQFQGLHEELAQLRLDLEGITKRSIAAAEKHARGTVGKSSRRWGAIAAVIVSLSGAISSYYSARAGATSAHTR